MLTLNTLYHEVSIIKIDKHPVTKDNIANIPSGYLSFERRDGKMTIKEKVLGYVEYKKEELLPPESILNKKYLFVDKRNKLLTFGDSELANFLGFFSNIDILFLCEQYPESTMIELGVPVSIEQFKYRLHILEYIINDENIFTKAIDICNDYKEMLKKHKKTPIVGIKTELREWFHSVDVIFNLLRNMFEKYLFDNYPKLYWEEEKSYNCIIHEDR